MINEHSVKNQIEHLHLDYLKRNFRLQTGAELGRELLDGSYPDLSNTGETIDSLFELKSSNHPLKVPPGKERYESQYAWWPPIAHQIARYEEVRDANEGLELYWIFLLSKTNRRPTEYSDPLKERSILHRDIWVVPWETYQLVEVTRSGYHHIGRARLERCFNFTKIQIPKGILSIEKCIEKNIRRYFT